MARPTLEKFDLTLRAVKAIDPTLAEIFWDSRLPGFGLRTRRQNDCRSWRWVCSFRGRGRGSQQVRLSKPFIDATPDQARKWAETERAFRGTALGQREREAQAQRLREQERLNPTVEELFNQYWEAEGRLKKTSRNYKQLWRAHLSPAFSLEKVQAVDPGAVERFKASKGSVPGACNRSLALLSRMFSLAVKWGYRMGCAPEHPVKGVARYPESPSEFHFSREELGRILEAATVDCDADRNAEASEKGHGCNRAGGLIIRLLGYTGARVGEVTQAHWSQFEFFPEEKGGGALWIVESSNTKAARPITRFLPPEIAKQLLDWRPIALGLQRESQVVSIGAADRLWWAFPQMLDPSKPMRRVQHVWKRVLKRAGLRRGRIHDLRHTVATYIVKDTQSLPAAQAQLGHATILTTRRYAHHLYEQAVETGMMLGRLGGEAEARAREEKRRATERGLAVLLGGGRQS